MKTFLAFISIFLFSCGPTDPPDHPIKKCQAFINRCNSIGDKPVFEGKLSMCYDATLLTQYSQDAKLEILKFEDDILEFRLTSFEPYVEIDSIHRYYVDCWLGGDAIQPAPAHEELTLHFKHEQDLEGAGHYFGYNRLSIWINQKIDIPECNNPTEQRHFSGRLIN